MQLPITVTNPLSAPAAQAMGRGLPWRAGAVLQAVVLEVAAPGRVELQIGSQTVSARTLFPLAEGQVLSLRVTHAGELVVLQHEPAGRDAAATRATDAAMAQQALRQALPRQAALPPLLANLSLLARAPQAFPPALVEAARAALKAVPDAANLAEPEALAAHIERSGLWLESSLAAHGEAPLASPALPLTQDWKATLLRLAASLSALTQPLEEGSSAAPAAPAATAAPAPEAAPAQSPAAPNATTSPAPAEPAPPEVLLAPATEVAPESGALPPATTADAQPAPPARTAGPVVAEAAPLLRASVPQPQARAEATLAQAHYRSDDVAASSAHLLKQVEGALARVELGQLASLRTDDAQAQAWWLELPVRATDGGTDVLQLRIEREGGAGGDEEQAVWAVSLAFDLGELGPVRARVAVRSDSVSTLFFAERTDTVERLRAQLDGLGAALAKRGLTVGSLGCRAGQPRQSPPGPTLPPDAPLLEVEA